MVVQLTRNNAPSLLRVVGKKPHASDADHEEVHEQQHGRAKVPTKEEEDEFFNVNAEPLSSDDDLRVPATRKSPTSKPTTVATKKTTREDSGELNVPQKRSSRKRPAIRAPARGALEKGRLDKAKRGLEDDKENAATSTPISSAGSAKDGPLQFDMEYSQQRLNKKAKSYGSKSKVTNIHAQVPRKAGIGRSNGKMRASGATGRSWNVKPQPKADVSSGSDVSMMSDEELQALLGPGEARVDDPELRTKEVRPKRSSDIGGSSKSTTFDDAELNNILNQRTKPARLLHQLGDWIQDQAPSSSQPDSSAPQEALDNIKDYIEQLPQEEEEGIRCALCKEEVKWDDYWDFWKGKDKTVKNHTAFCNTHRRKSAQEDYEREGYPKIDWDALPKRIRKHRMELFQVLNNDLPSEYRDRYEPIALTGKAAAVPSRRKDLSETMQKELDSYALDDQATYPGYYGPHGRRAITENVMKVLKNEIKNCRDPVVQASGPAAFIQAVLVPEVAILLIMEDCKADREEAEDIREKTYDMGLLLNEEIEDKIEVQDDSDDANNEYHHG